MLGFNGGLLGKRRVPSVGVASGLWFPNEQSVAQRAGIWPEVVTDPTPGLSPLLWYDFADESTVSVSSGQVAQINSKGSTAWSLTKSATGPDYVTGINGMKCANWGGSPHSNYLRNTSTASMNMAEFYLVLDASFGSVFPAYNGVFSTGNQWSVTGFQNRDGFYAEAFNQAYINGSSVNAYAGVIVGSPAGILPAINTASLLRIVGSAANTTSGFQLGMDRNIAGRGWYGLMGEVIVFSSPLSTQDRTTLQNWLASKWGITLS